MFLWDCPWPQCLQVAPGTAGEDHEVLGIEFGSPPFKAGALALPG